jgi:hypothetical protein
MVMSESLDDTRFRLLKILRNTSPKSEVIEVTLATFDLGTDVDYTCLSYHWGDPTPTHTIIVNGISRGIHENLWQFLHHMQQDECGEYLWTDPYALWQREALLRSD